MVGEWAGVEQRVVSMVKEVFDCVGETIVEYVTLLVARSLGIWYYMTQLINFQNDFLL